MQVIVSARNCDVTDTLRETVVRSFDRLERYEPRATRAEVRLVDEKDGCKVDASINIHGSGMVHASAAAADPRTAVDRTVAKLARQLKRNHSRRHSRKGKGQGGAPTEVG